MGDRTGRQSGKGALQQYGRQRPPQSSASARVSPGVDSTTILA
ncbi:hypothetical protein BZL29_8537 [Mycobacterium kansasii]|uniref:Uncharacterized protein n=1 Tax=Mycobacterium kansasii TaxID=1768 RepID=A0A1V3W933_MYCKA|nr:hypothetical protein BZL29_8537 [Mycobacterium kansasii]